MEPPKIKIRLKDFYKENKITASDEQNFACKHLNECKNACNQRPLFLGSDSYIGKDYGSPFSVVVISLDRGQGSLNIDAREDEVEKIIAGSDHSLHMDGTQKVLEMLLPNIIGKNVFYNMALINSAKCCTKDNSMTSSPEFFFHKCSEYIIGELSILNPDIIITQGSKAKLFLLTEPEKKTNIEIQLIHDYFSSQGLSTDSAIYLTISRSILDFVFFLEINTEKKLLISLPHPSSRQYWYAFQNYIIPIVIDFVRYLLKIK